MLPSALWKARSPAGSRMMSSNTPVPGSLSTCQMKLTELLALTLPFGLLPVTLSASCTPAIDTVSMSPTDTWPPVESERVGRPVGEALPPASSTVWSENCSRSMFTRVSLPSSPTLSVTLNTPLPRSSMV
ncbi:hypothetical protein D9M69_290210 [compost metagenome]